MNAEKTAQIIEKEAMKEIDCRNVLEKAADNDSENKHTELNNTVSQNTFCTNKKICSSTGKVLNWYNILGSNTATCANIKQKYKTFEDMSNKSVGGKKTSRKRIKRKNITRRSKKNRRRSKKKAIKSKKNTRKSKKNTRRVKFSRK